MGPLICATGCGAGIECPESCRWVCCWRVNDTLSSFFLGGSPFPVQLLQHPILATSSVHPTKSTTQRDNFLCKRIMNYLGSPRLIKVSQTLTATTSLGSKYISKTQSVTTPSPPLQNVLHTHPTYKAEHKVLWQRQLGSVCGIAHHARKVARELECCLNKR